MKRLCTLCVGCSRFKRQHISSTWAKAAPSSQDLIARQFHQITFAPLSMETREGIKFQVQISKWRHFSNYLSSWSLRLTLWASYIILDNCFDDAFSEDRGSIELLLYRSREPAGHGRAVTDTSVTTWLCWRPQVLETAGRTTPRRRGQVGQGLSNPSRAPCRKPTRHFMIKDGTLIEESTIDSTAITHSKKATAPDPSCQLLWIRLIQKWGTPVWDGSRSDQKPPLTSILDAPCRPFAAQGKLELSHTGPEAKGYELSTPSMPTYVIMVTERLGQVFRPRNRINSTAVAFGGGSANGYLRTIRLVWWSEVCETAEWAKTYSPQSLQGISVCVIEIADTAPRRLARHAIGSCLTSCSKGNLRRNET
jgi:hypothetical protein